MQTCHIYFTAKSEQEQIPDRELIGFLEAKEEYGFVSFVFDDSVIMYNKKGIFSLQFFEIEPSEENLNEHF